MVIVVIMVLYCWNHDCGGAGYSTAATTMIVISVCRGPDHPRYPHPIPYPYPHPEQASAPRMVINPLEATAAVYYDYSSGRISTATDYNDALYCTSRTIKKLLLVAPIKPP